MVYRGRPQDSAGNSKGQVVVSSLSLLAAGQLAQRSLGGELLACN
jgi:hypothetical protein